MFPPVFDQVSLKNSLILIYVMKMQRQVSQPKQITVAVHAYMDVYQLTVRK